MARPTLHVQCASGHWAHGYPEHNADPGAALTCPPDSVCCDGSKHPGQTHQEATMAGHAGHEGDHTAENPACSVCRPVTITALEGSIETLQMADRGSA